ncbi:unnamed protein product [Polarella glacialis]|uniref:RRM domain-containing protein n=1 Tax=Polarella glacialis TaxID=89957 RepID=A0A813L6W2_POLGL|nr:unnamed protein product [Polarella glacialis]
MTEEAIREYFAKAGPIVKYEGMCKGRQARLTYSSAADAKNAVASLNGITIEGNIHPLVVQISRRKPKKPKVADGVEKTQKIKKELPTAEETQVYAVGFDKDMTEEAIREYFAKAGPIVKYEATRRGKARLTYSSAADAKNAVASLNGITIEGNIHPLSVRIFTHKATKSKVADGVEKTQKQTSEGAEAGFLPNCHFDYKLIKMETTVVNNCLFVVVSMLNPVFVPNPVRRRRHRSMLWALTRTTCNKQRKHEQQ